MGHSVRSNPPRTMYGIAARGGRVGRGRGRIQTHPHSAITKRPKTSRVVVVNPRQAPQQNVRALQTADSGQCLISENTDIKAAAGYVAALLREGNPPQVLAISAGNVNR